MGVLDNGGLMDGLTPMAFDVKPRVFVRMPGEEYEEIVDVKAFERVDDQGGATISFAMHGDQSGSVKDILGKGSDTYVDVKMEFMIGTLMVMSFSGFVEAFYEDKVSFAVSTPITTDVLDVAQ